LWFILLFKIPIYYSSADFSGSFWLKRKSGMTTDITVSTKFVCACVFFLFNFDFMGGCLHCTEVHYQGT